MLGDELRAARLAAKMTQEALAYQAGLSRNYVSLLERNEKSPTVEVLIRLCKAMDVSAGDIIKRLENER